MALSVERENRLAVQTAAKTGQELATSTVNEAFLALVCTDDELLRAEFAAIIDASWHEPPPSRWMRRPVPPPRRPWWHLAGAPAISAPPRHPGVGGWVRQRSPPPGVPGKPAPSARQIKEGR